MSKWILIFILALLPGRLPSAISGDGAVQGFVRRPVPAHRVPGAHVHVQLLDAHGQVIAERVARLSPTAPRRDATANYRTAYLVRFARGEMARAVSHRAILHLEAHRS